MASQQSPLSSRRTERTNCSICKETLKDPKALPCLHTFCLECLKNYGKNEQPGDEMLCPLCRKLFKIPEKGFEDLPNNFFIQDMLTDLTIPDESQEKSLKCDVCDAMSIKYCSQCDQNLCSTCTASHGRITATASHTVVAIKENESSRVSLKAQPRFCDSHKDEQLKLYCTDCNLVICLICSVLHHKKHVCKDLGAASEKFSKKLKSGFGQLSDCMQANRDELEQLDFDKTNLFEQVSASEKTIIERSKEMKHLIDCQRDQMLKELEEFKKERLKKMRARKDEVEKQLLIIATHKQHLEKLTEKGSACDITRGAADRLARTEELVKSQDEFSKDSLNSFDVIFTAARLRRVPSGSTELLGQLTFEEYAKEKTMVIIGWNDGSVILQQVCQVSLERQNSVMVNNSLPRWIDKEAAACVVGNTLYAVGIGRGFNELWKWNMACDWTRCEDMTSSRCRHCVAVVDSTLYVLGGWVYTDETTLSSVEAYNIQTNKWSAAGQLSHAVRSSACATYNQTIYIFGGYNSLDQAVDYVQEYNIFQQACNTINSMPVAHAVMRAVVWKTYAILLQADTCLVYDFERQNWRERRTLGTDVQHFGAVLNYQTLYIAGGGTINRVKGKTSIWTCTDEVLSVSVCDVIKGKETAWKHHAKLPQPALLHAYSQKPMYLRRTT